MAFLPRLSATVAVGVVLVAAVGEALADTVIAPVKCAPGVRVCSGLTTGAFAEMWSTWDARSRRYRAMQWKRMEGINASRMPIPGRRDPFDIDVGFVRGSQRAVYSRCAGDARGPRRGCAVFIWDGATERRLGAPVSDAPLPPAIGGAGGVAGRLAVAVKRSGRPVRLRLCNVSGASCRRLPRGPLGSRPMRAGPTSMDLAGRRLAIAWSWRDAGVAHSEILLVRNVLKRGRLSATRVASGSGRTQVFGPSLDIGVLFYAQGDPRCDGGPTRMVSFSPVSGSRVERDGPPMSAFGHAARMALFISCPRPGVRPAITIREPYPFG